MSLNFEIYDCETEKLAETVKLSASKCLLRSSLHSGKFLSWLTPPPSRRASIFKCRGLHLKFYEIHDLPTRGGVGMVLETCLTCWPIRVLIQLAAQISPGSIHILAFGHIASRTTYQG